LSIAVALYRLKHEDMLRRLLKVVESTSRALGVDAATAVYTKVADTVLGGIEEVVGMDGAAIPVLGRRQEFQPVEAGFYALIDGEAPLPPKGALWVRQNQL